MDHLLLSEIFPPQHGGSGRWLYETHRRLPIEQLAVVNNPNDSSSQFESYGHLVVASINFNLIDTGGFSPRGLFSYVRLLSKTKHLLRGKKIKFASAARVVPEGWALWLWRTFFNGPEFRIFAHGEEVNLIGREESGVMSSRQHRWMAKLSFSSASEIIANSQNTASILRAQWNIPEEKIRIINPGVDTDFFFPAMEQHPQNDFDREALDWSNRFIVLTVGRLQKRKGHDRVIEAINRLRSEIPNILYVIAGSGECEDSLRDEVQNKELTNHVTFINNFNDQQLRSLYQKCDVFALANRQIGSDVEGFGMVLLEAAACGKPTIAGNSGGTKEAIQDGITGLLVNADNVDEIANAISFFFSNPEIRSEFGRRGRTWVVENFDWKSVSGQIMSPKMASLTINN